MLKIQARHNWHENKIVKVKCSWKASNTVTSYQNKCVANHLIEVVCVYTNLFKLRAIVKQVILTYIKHSYPYISHGVQFLLFLTREKRILTYTTLICWMLRNWYHLLLWLRYDTVRDKPLDLLLERWTLYHWAIVVGGLELKYQTNNSYLSELRRHKKILTIF